MEIIQTSQFFDITGMTWAELFAGEPKGVIPDSTGKFFLWAETPKHKVVTESDEVLCGYVWYIQGENGLPKVYKAKYDSSD